LISFPGLFWKHAGEAWMIFKVSWYGKHVWLDTNAESHTHKAELF